MFKVLKVRLKMLLIDTFSHRNRAKGIKQMPTDELISYIKEDSSDETRAAVDELVARYMAMFRELVSTIEEGRLR